MRSCFYVCGDERARTEDVRLGMVSSLCRAVHDWLMRRFRRMMLWHDYISRMRIRVCTMRRIEELLRVRIGRRNLRRWTHAVISRRVVWRADAMRVRRSVVMVCRGQVGVVRRSLGVGVYHRHHRWRGEQRLWCMCDGWARIARWGRGSIHHSRSRQWHGGN
jgi:hypothetical protein